MPEDMSKEPGPFTAFKLNPSEILPDWCYEPVPEPEVPEPFIPCTSDPE
jgi:hypothetical protein